ncbi:MAG: hypothetical protein WCG95_01255 [bacterium]
MFKNLLDFSYKRNFSEAMGFYVACLPLGIILVLITAKTYFNLLEIVALIFNMSLALKIMYKKKLFSNFLAVLLLSITFMASIAGHVLLNLTITTTVLFSFRTIIALLGGVLLGLIPVAILSSMPFNDEIITKHLPMFKKLMDFSYKRTFIEAVGFYIAYLFLSFLLIEAVFVIFVGIAVIGLIPIPSSEIIIRGSVSIVLTIFNIFLALKIVYDKKIFGNFGAILLLLVTILFSALGGALLGLIPVSALSSMSAKKNQAT